MIPVVAVGAEDFEPCGETVAEMHDGDHEEDEGVCGAAGVIPQ